MPQSSIFGYVAPTPDDAFDEGQPVASSRALELNQNLLHLTDEFAQTRINWVARDAEGIFEASAPVDPVIWSQTYPHTWLGPNKPANVDIRLEGEDLVARCRLVPFSAPHGSGTGPAVFDQLLNLGSGGIVSAEYTHQNDAASVGVFEKGWFKPAAVAAVGVDGIFEPQVCLMRLEITCLAETGFQIVSVQLREFA